jgi:hypothetical protein
MLRVNPEFLHSVLWKEYEEYCWHLEKLVNEITSDLIVKIHQHQDEEVVSQ